MTEEAPQYKAYVWDRYFQGAFVIVAESAEQAAELFKRKYPTGVKVNYSHQCTERVLPEVQDFTEVLPGEMMVTEGDL